MTTPKFLVNEETIMFAFMYCLTRSSYAQSDGIEMIREHWDSLDRSNQLRIISHIDRISSKSFFSTECLLPGWKDIMNLQVKPI